MRLKAIDPEHLTAEQQVVFDAIASGPRKGVRGPLAIWLHHPKLANLAQSLGQYCRYDSCLEPRLSELAILLMGRHWLAEYEWAAHKPYAIEAGLSTDLIEAIRLGEQPVFIHKDEQLIYQFICELHETKRVSEQTYREIEQLLGTDTLIDLVAIAGYYTLISMTINVFEVPPPAGVTPELPTPEAGI
ncbi:carboxymuconolactone decarboxylase family protein [Acinetobacter geminorum]|uniref:carboxymuconolactone decarboxylase family protein n=1 Tax=Acinetobacter geminorum TaxID=2730922 RepID=UPI003AF743B6